MNKSVKQFLQNCFEQWDADPIIEQLEENEKTEVEEVSLKPVDLSFLLLKELGVKWLVDMFDYLHENPLLILNGFVCSGITGAFDNHHQSGTSNYEEPVDACSNSSFDSSDSD